MNFSRFIAIDYSGAGNPLKARDNITVYQATIDQPPTPALPGLWSRETVHQYLVGLMKGPPTLIGLDHGFSWPEEALGTAGVTSWIHFLEYIEGGYGCLRQREISNQDRESALFAQFANHLRLTERRTTSAKPVLCFRPHGVSWSTLAGLPWLSLLHREHREQIHFWPFDGWRPERGKHCIVEVYPTLFRRLYEEKTIGLSGDERDAFCPCSWMRDMARHHLLECYFEPPRTESESAIALREGWILGVM